MTQKKLKQLSQAIAEIIATHLDAPERGGVSSVKAPTKRKLSPSAMRCRFEVDGVRCTARSGGPRFRYLCEDHR